LKRAQNFASIKAYRVSAFSSANYVKFIVVQNVS